MLNSSKHFIKIRKGNTDLKAENLRKLVLIFNFEVLNT